MSHRQQPRTPEFFPRMKVRGARRRRLAPWQRAAGSMRRFGWVLQEVTIAAWETGETLNKFARTAGTHRLTEGEKP